MVYVKLNYRFRNIVKKFIDVLECDPGHGIILLYIKPIIRYLDVYLSLNVLLYGFRSGSPKTDIIFCTTFVVNVIIILLNFIMNLINFLN